MHRTQFDLTGGECACDRFPLRSRGAIAAAPEREMQCERIRKLISRWHRDELGAERKAARRKCSKALAPILDITKVWGVVPSDCLKVRAK